MAFGSIYSRTWFGAANEDNTIGWGIFYPIIAGGSTLVLSIADFVISTIRFSIDETEI
jgi:hypothetical protein